MARLILECLGECTPEAPCMSCAVVNFVAHRYPDTPLTPLVRAMHSARQTGEDAYLELSIQDLDISTGVKVRLMRRDAELGGPILTVRQLVTCTEAQLLKIPNFGRKSLNEVKEVLATYGLRLRIPD